MNEGTAEVGTLGERGTVQGDTLGERGTGEVGRPWENKVPEIVPVLFAMLSQGCIESILVLWTAGVQNTPIFPIKSIKSTDFVTFASSRGSILQNSVS